MRNDKEQYSGRAEQREIEEWTQERICAVLGKSMFYMFKFIMLTILVFFSTYVAAQTAFFNQFYL